MRVISDRSGSSAAEMALSLPLLLALLFGCFELGNYFLSEHAVQKAVRDAARYASRLSMVNYDCAGPTVDSAAETEIQRVARFGDPDGTGSQRLPGWAADADTAVTLTCDDDATHTYVNNGVYKDFPNSGAVPVVTVTATVPYNMLFGVLGFSSTTLNLRAESQAAVFGA